MLIPLHKQPTFILSLEAGAAKLGESQKSMAGEKSICAWGTS